MRWSDPRVSAFIRGEKQLMNFEIGGAGRS
jgi:hypothetical protein